MNSPQLTAYRNPAFLSKFQTLYDTSSVPDSDLLDSLNPFAEDFKCVVNSTKGGVFITENICYSW